MRSDTKRLLNLLQLLSEIAIAAGYLLGLIPFVYAWSCSWVIPLVFVNLVFAILTGNGTTLKTIMNICLGVPQSHSSARLPFPIRRTTDVRTKYERVIKGKKQLIRSRENG